MNKFSFQKQPEKKKTSSSSHDNIIKQLDSMEVRKLDQTNPMEQAKKFDIVRENPPAPGFMKVDLVETKDKQDIPVVESVSTDEDGEEKRIREDPFFTIDLYSAVQANIAKCPSNVGPMLLDQNTQLVMNEKKEFKPDKRKKEFDMLTIGLISMSLVGVVVLVLYLFA